MKNNVKLNAIREEVIKNNRKFTEITEENLIQITGGWNWGDDWGDEGYFGRIKEGLADDRTQQPLRVPLR